MTNEEFNEEFRRRIKAFVIDVLDYLEMIPLTPVSRVMIFQLAKCSSSAGANFRAFCRGRSKNEKFAKICIVVEEADETQYWLEIFCKRYPLHTANKILLEEATEITAITTSIKNKFYPG